MERNSNNDFVTNFRLKATFVDHPDYKERACRESEVNIFFPNTYGLIERRKSLTEAAALCASCIVREECLQTAIANDEKDGFFGGVDFYKSMRSRARLNSLKKNNTDII